MNLENVLKSYGLTNKQTSLYLACLGIGSASVYKIGQKVKIPRSTCYEVLESLKGLGLVTTFRKKKVIYYAAEEPKIFIKSLKEKIYNLERALPEFSAMFGGSKQQPTVRLYQGLENMKIIFQEVLDEADDIASFSSVEDLFIVFGSYWTEFVNKRIKKKIPVRAILTESARARQRKAIGTQELRKVKIISADYKHHGLIMIWQRKIAMFSFEKEMIALVIESHELARTQMAWFNFFWNMLPE